ncbi:MAG: HEAT repeat domain-containing protein [Desulfomonile tiedjei]|nr:HEAT repeat domain-containing protein [Desulfomonile tiedjei]
MQRRFSELSTLRARQAINPLLSFLLHENETVRWRAVAAIGHVIAGLADEDMESARVIMRRLMWTLNDESGGIGWGAPEAMAEIMARHRRLAEEFSPVVVSYLDTGGNFIEYEMLQRGLLWGIARLAAVRPELLGRATEHLDKYLYSGDSSVRGLAAVASGLLGATQNRDRLKQLLEDGSRLKIYSDDTFVERTVGELAQQSLTRMDRKSS